MSVLLIIRDESKASSMLHWGLSFAEGQNTGLDVLWLEDGDQVAEVEWESWRERAKPEHWIHIEEELVNYDHEALPVRVSRVGTLSYYKTVIRTVKALKPSLLIAGLHSADSIQVHQKLVYQILDDVFCAVIILRATDGALPNRKILLPCGGGPHSRKAIKLVAACLGKQATALFVEPDIDEISADVGEVRLRKILYRAGVDPDSVEHKVVVSNSVSRAVGHIVQQGEYGLILIGASQSGTIRRKLFGTIPEKVLRGETAMDVGIIRGERPVRHRMREVFERWLHLSVPQLRRSERVELFGEIEDKARWSFDFGALMILATSIAGLGLLSNSGAVVIGAMLVAPLMMPLLGGGLALVQGNWPLWKKSQFAVLLGFLSALFIGLLLGVIARGLGLPLTEELASRGAPTTLDLGIAFISGVAASYCVARPKLSGALAGVAIAAALVPPIATVGICLTMGYHEVAAGASLLFGTNVVAIVLGAGVSFFFAGVRGNQNATGVWSKRMGSIFLIVLIGLVIPLSSVFMKQRDCRGLESRLGVVLDQYDVCIVDARLSESKGNRALLELTLEAPEVISAQRVSELAQEAQLYLKRDVRLVVKTVLVAESGQ